MIRSLRIAARGTVSATYRAASGLIASANGVLLASVR